MARTQSKTTYLFPLFLSKEGRWFVASCPLLGIATQGRTEKEVRENIEDLIRGYLADSDTSKDMLRNFSMSSLSYLPIEITSELRYGKTSAAAAK